MLLAVGYVLPTAGAASIDCIPVHGSGAKVARSLSYHRIHCECSIGKVEQVVGNQPLETTVVAPFLIEQDVNHLLDWPWVSTLYMNIDVDVPHTPRESILRDAHMSDEAVHLSVDFSLHGPSPVHQA